MNNICSWFTVRATITQLQGCGSYKGNGAHIKLDEVNGACFGVCLR